MNIHIDGVFAAVSPPLPRSPYTARAMEASRKTLLVSLLFSSTRARAVWLLLVSVSLAAADSMADKTQLPSRDRALKGREEKVVVAGK